MRKTVTLTLVALLMLCFVGYASATITTTATIHLYYNDGSHVDLPAGTYTSIERINNFWYVNGEIYPASAATPIPVQIASITNQIWLAIGFLIILPTILAAVIILAATKGNDFNRGTVLVLLGLIITVLVGIIILIALMNAVA